MTDAIPHKTATEELAQQIVDQLCAEGLVPEIKRGELLIKLKSGRINAQDWRLLIELGIDSQLEIPNG